MSDICFTIIGASVHENRNITAIIGSNMTIIDRRTKEHRWLSTQSGEPCTHKEHVVVRMFRCTYG